MSLCEFIKACKFYLTFISKVEMVVYLKPLDSNSELLNILSLTSVFPIFHFIMAAGFPPFEMQVSFKMSPAMKDKVPLEST